MLNKKALAASVSAAPAEYVEDVFSTYLTTGAGSDITVVNDIDLSGEGGLVWNKTRNTTGFHTLFDTARGANKALFSNATNAESTSSNWLSFNNNGFTIGTTNNLATSSTTGVSWTFRKAPKFFDVVTYTGNGTAGRTVAHNLGSTPGMMIVKCTSTSGNWSVYHRSRGATERGILNLTNAFGANNTIWNDTEPTSTVFTVGDNAGVNSNGATYVAYLFAHNAGGFGAAGTDNIISCGTFTTDGSGNATVNLGYEPQYILCKYTSTSPWYVFDTMRGFSLTAQTALFPNTSSAENTYTGTGLFPTATGFSTEGTSLFDANATLIYMAIRRPMKTPTSGTEVFSPVAQNASANAIVTTNFPVDLALSAQRDRTAFPFTIALDRLRGSTAATSAKLATSSTNAESNFSSDNGFNLASNTTIVDNLWNGLYGASNSIIYWNFRRATGFFDIVCYTGTGSATTVNHNLGAVPQLMMVKSRSASWGWHIYDATNGATNYMRFNTDPSTALSTVWNDTTPTSTVFSVGSSVGTNQSGTTYAAYLFATVAGVSKVGTYNGTGANTTNQINCGFTSGARFVMIKRTNATGNWFVFDTARGITSGNDPFLALNTTNAENGSFDVITPYSAGFNVNDASDVGLNETGGTFIYLAIA